MSNYETKLAIQEYVMWYNAQHKNDNSIPLYFGDIDRYMEEREVNKISFNLPVSGSVSSSEMTEQNKELERLRKEGDKRFGSKKHFR